MRKIINAIGVLAVVVSAVLAGIDPAGATSGSTVEVTSGKLTITGTTASDEIRVNQIAPGSYAVWITPNGGTIDVHNVTGVTGDVVIDPAGGGTDRVKVGDGAGTSFPGSLTIKPQVGENSITIDDTIVSNDLILFGSAAVDIRTSHVSDDLLGTSGSDALQINLADSSVGDLYQLRSTQRGGISTSIRDSSVGRLRVTGNSGHDFVWASTSDLGANPRVTLGSGNDTFRVAGDSAWSGTLTHIAGNGNDRFEVRDDTGVGQPIAEVRIGKLNVQLGNGDDDAQIDVPVTTSGSVINGQGGFDRLEGTAHSDPSSNASYRLFESIEGGDNDLIDVSTANGDLTVTVKDTLVRLTIDRYGDDFSVAYQVPGTSDLIGEIHSGIDGDVSVILEADLLDVEIGLNAPATLPGDVNLSIVDGAAGRFELVDLSIAGDLKITAEEQQLSVQAKSIEVSGRLDVRSIGDGKFSFASFGSTFGRTRVNGANGRDNLYFLEGSDLGTSPIVTLRGGDDEVVTGDATWAGRLQLNAGSGNDDFTSQGTVDLGRIRLLMGAGDDSAAIHGIDNDGQGSILQGDSGTDSLEHVGSIDRATVRTFETVEQTV